MLVFFTHCGDASYIETHKDKKIYYNKAFNRVSPYLHLVDGKYIIIRYLQISRMMSDTEIIYEGDGSDELYVRLIEPSVLKVKKSYDIFDPAFETIYVMTADPGGY